MNYQIVLHDERKRFGLLPRITIFHETIVFLVINLTGSRYLAIVKVL